MTPQLILSHMRDIHGLDPVGLWPPAPGWWLLTLLIIAVAALVYRFRHRIGRRASGVAWRRDAIDELSALEKKIGHTTPKAVAVGLSELLRRIAVSRCGRDACAGLEGERWLHWLAANDRSRFAWPEHKQALLELPYAPPQPTDGRELNLELRRLIAAARRWARQEPPCSTAEERRNGV